ncbi:MAG TPA: signal peptidase I [Steroidobacteraceae bacterium]|nr:signal peptidase I [Steroidobacteraceae bacterium]
MMDFTNLIATLAMIAIPVTLVAVVDDWLLRPRRLLAGEPDPAWVQGLYLAVPVLLLAAVWRLITSERLDFSLVLVAVVVVSALVLAVDRWVLAPRRVRPAPTDPSAPAAEPLPEPVTVDYARSFLPVALIVLLVRGFIFEPFRIPSDSMMPTLLQGDFLVVNKFAYGLRLPVLGTKLLDTGTPQRGDVVVFRYPPDPAINYIKRLVGLPGDHVKVIHDQLIINGTPIPLVQDAARYDDGCYHNMRRSTEVLGTHTHGVLSCLTDDGLVGPATPATCNRRNLDHSYQCIEPDSPGLIDRNDTLEEIVVPAGQYLMIGDNRDNSADGRYFGFVPENDLIGRATRIWLNLDGNRAASWYNWSHVINWSRIGQKIE